MLVHVSIILINYFVWSAFCRNRKYYVEFTPKKITRIPGYPDTHMNICLICEASFSHRTLCIKHLVTYRCTCTCTCTCIMYYVFHWWAQKNKKDYPPQKSFHRNDFEADLWPETWDFFGPKTVFKISLLNILLMGPGKMILQFVSSLRHSPRPVLFSYPFSFITSCIQLLK